MKISRTIHAAFSHNEREKTPADVLRQRRYFFSDVGAKNGGPEPGRRSHRRQLIVGLLACCQRPYERREFRTAGHDHETNGPVDFPRLVPPLDEAMYFGANGIPYTRCRPEDHFRRQHRIDGHGETNRVRHDRNAVFLARDSLGREQNRLFPRRLVQDFRAQPVARRAFADRAAAYKVFDFVTAKPFLKLLMLKGKGRLTGP